LTAQNGTAPPGEWRRHGWIVLPCFAGNLLGSIHAYSLGAMIAPLEGEFGWSRAGITGGLLIISVVAIFVAPVVGMAVDRFGPRRVAIPGIVFHCLALGLLSTTGSSLMNWWSLWLFVAFSNMCIAPMLWTAAINARFDRNRGMALALALCGTSVGAATVPLLTTVLIEAQGWRGAYISLALIGFIGVMPLILLLFRDVRPQEDQGASPTDAPSQGRLFEIRGQATSPTFLKLAGAVLMFTMALCVFTTNGVPVLLGEGFTAVAAASVAGATGLGSLSGRLLGGYLLDRYTARVVAAIAVTLPAASCALLLGTDASVPVATFAFFMIGLSSGVEYDAVAYLAARHFGMRHFGALFGIVTGFILLSNGIGPAGANLVYDLVGSYEPVVWTTMCLFLGASALFYLTGPYPREFEREAGNGPQGE
jgi:MFS family permease